MILPVSILPHGREFHPGTAWEEGKGRFPSFRHSVSFNSFAKQIGQIPWVAGSNPSAMVF